MKSLVAHCFSTAALLALSSLSLAEPMHGIAMHGEPALPADFKHLPYVNPDAPKGGILRQAVSGTFDSVNPFIVKGTAANGIRTYVFESMLGRNWEEPFSLYGLLAESIDVSDDRQTITFKLRPEAKFSDGTSVTSADVLFTMETLRDKGRPNFKNSYSKIKTIEVKDERTLVFKQEVGDRELPLIIGLMPILSKTSWANRTFEDSTLDPIIGSGPYKIVNVRAGESISYQRNPAYWGANLNVSKGLWNFDTVRFDYFKDANAAFESFKKGDIDVRIESDPVRWTTGYDFPAVNEGKIKLKKVLQRSPAATTGFAFNTRRKHFEDVRVREALAMAFDFEWANANLFSNSFKRTYGYFGGSDLSSQSKPADAAELSILGDAASNMPDTQLKGEYSLPVTDGSGRDRKVLRKVVELLAAAGWVVSDTAMINSAGEPLIFTITVQNRDQEKIALHYQRTLAAIGIKADIKLADAAQFASMQKSYDYDMIPVSWFNSLSPGNEQKAYFGSSGKTTEGTRNYPGIADSAVDRAIDAMLKARTREELVTAARAEDRLLVAGHYIIPFYDAGGQWVAHWDTIGVPEQQPLPGFEATTLWSAK